VVGFPRKSPRNMTVVAPREIATKRNTNVPIQSSNTISMGAAPRPATCGIHRDSRKQFNVSARGAFYEKAKSRRVRQRVALEQSGSQQSAVALGAGRRTATASSSNMEDLENEYKNKSFRRSMTITHKLKEQRLRNQQLEQLKQQERIEAKKKIRQEREEYPRRNIPTRFHRKPHTDTISQIKSRAQPVVANTTKPTTRQEREEDHQRRFPNQSQRKSHPDSEFEFELESKSELESRTQKQSRAPTQPAVAKATKPTTRQEQDEDHQRRFSNQPQRNSQPHSNSDSDLDSDSDSELPTRKQQESKQKKTNLHRQRQELVEQQIIPNVAQNVYLTAKPVAAVIDLLSSDSDSDSDGSENDMLLTLTQFLQDEAIGRGAARNEMKVYAQHLFRLGLHSREMILDALDFDSNGLDDSNDARWINTDMASDTVNGWEWIKPFHKTVFYRWVWREQQRQRRERTQKNAHPSPESKNETKVKRERYV